MDLKSSELQELFDANAYQLSELCFFDDEVKFLQNMLTRHFTELLEDSHYNRIQLNNNKLNSLIRLRGYAENDAKVLRDHLKQKAQEEESKSYDYLLLESHRLDGKLKDLIEDLRKVKTEIFALYKSALAGSKATAGAFKEN